MNQPPSQQHPQLGHPSWSIKQKMAAVVAALITMVPLIGLAGAGASQLMQLGKTQSTVEMQQQKISDLMAEKTSLTAKNEKLLETVRSLELNLESTKSKLSNTEGQLATNSNQLSLAQSEISGLRQQIAQNNPCLSIQRTIAALEAQLDLHDTYQYLLMGPRRTETQAQLAEHQSSLRSCLGHRS
ncbi:hypothetical protein MYA83_12640 [Pseudomonas palleroniana]|uniref:hypothetical protein n=1 Tax=Pseudomonas palleroniana TaxID=191390 RepID=UPI003B00A671